MTTGSGDFDLTLSELRVIARYSAESAQSVLAAFERVCPDDPRPRSAIDAAWEFVNGGSRSKLQRVASLDAHRAAKSAPTEIARLAAQAAGDAAAAAYLHPIAKATQVGHILRAAASAARIAEIEADEGGDIGAQAVAAACGRADAILVDVLRRYPPAPAGKSRVARLMSALDAQLRRN